MATVVVTDGQQRAALAIVRSLGARGHRVVVTAPRARSLAGSSRYAASSSVCPDPLVDSESFARTLASVVAAETKPIIIPVTEAATYAVLQNRERFPDAIVPTGALASFAALCDKADVACRAMDVGIAVPRQITLGSRNDVGALVGVPPFPLVVKPARSVAASGTGGAKHTVCYAADQAGLAAALDKLHPGAFPVLLQQRIEGPGVGVFLLRWNGTTLAAFAHRRIREKPPSGGVSVLRESIALDPDLVVRSENLLDCYGWNGVAMVEYKLDGSGTPYLMEINGRFWGSLQLAIDAGVDFPGLLVAAALGTPSPGPRDYRIGVRSRWEWGDVDHLLTRLRRSRSSLALPPGAPGRGRVVASFLGSFLDRRTRCEVLRMRDPAPFLSETVSWFTGR